MSDEQQVNPDRRHMLPVGDRVQHMPNMDCPCGPVEVQPDVVAHRMVEACR